MNEFDIHISNTQYMKRYLKLAFERADKQQHRFRRRAIYNATCDEGTGTSRSTRVEGTTSSRRQTYIPLVSEGILLAGISCENRNNYVVGEKDNDRKDMYSSRRILVSVMPVCTMILVTVLLVMMIHIFISRERNILMVKMKLTS